jgi:hypothetical protein
VKPAPGGGGGGDRGFIAEVLTLDGFFETLVYGFAFWYHYNIILVNFLMDINQY